MPAAGVGAPRFVVHEHRARSLHFDLRLEIGGVLVSWAVPKGPSYDPSARRLAVHVDDHDLDHIDVEGTHPDGRGGHGAKIVWDTGTFRPIAPGDADGDRSAAAAAAAGGPVLVDPAGAVAAGHLSVWLEGEKLRGGWSLTRTGRPGAREPWILVKRRDGLADAALDIVATAPGSVLSGHTVESLVPTSDGVTAATSRPPGSGVPSPTAGPARWLPPQLATLAPAGRLPEISRGAWRLERKLDGLRCVAVRNGTEVQLWSRNHLSFTARFPAVVAALAALAADSFTIDGELVAWDGDTTSFSLLQNPRPATRPVLAAFDLLSVLGRDVTTLALGERHALLRRVLEGGDDVLGVVDAVDGDPVQAWAAACAQGWEGLVAKRVDRPYRPGRSPEWLKIKCSASQELVVGGWTEPTGSRTGFGALLLGVYDDAGRLTYAGKVGTGFDHQTLRRVHRALLDLGADTPPFAGVLPTALRRSHWVRPELVVAVSFAEWTAEGRLRHPSFRGLRHDKDPRTVRREAPPRS